MIDTLTIPIKTRKIMITSHGQSKVKTYNIQSKQAKTLKGMMSIINEKPIRIKWKA